jgi:hypothetical protein
MEGSLSSLGPKEPYLIEFTTDVCGSGLCDADIVHSYKVKGKVVPVFNQALQHEDVSIA